MKDFTGLVLNELNSLYNIKLDSGFNELIMALFMQIFSYHYDNHTSNDVKYNDIDKIMEIVWIKEQPKQIANSFLGVPYFNDEVSKSEFVDMDNVGKTEFILNKIRNSIVHGSFKIDSSNNTISIYDDRDGFEMIFEFACIVDICNLIFESLYSGSEVAKELFDFKTFIENISSYDEENVRSQLEKTEFRNLRYPIILFNMLPMNEDDFHNDLEYANFIIKITIMLKK